MISHFRFTCLLLFLSWNLQAQSVAFRNYSVSNGLSSSEIYSILQDSKGYMWFSSDAGVCRFDGYSFRTFTSEHGLSDNTIFNMYEDPKGRIWFFGMSNKLSYYDPERDSVISIAGNEELVKLLGRASITSICLGKKDTLFVGLDYGKTFYKIPPADNYSKILPLAFETEGWQFYFLSKKDAVWGLTSSIKKTTELSVTIYNELKQKISYNKYPDYQMHLFNNRTHSVFFGKDKVLFSENDQLNFLKKDSIFCTYLKDVIKIYVDKQDNIWLGTKINGVFEYKNSDLSKPPVHYLPKLSVTSIYEDNEGSYWFSTLEHGVYYTPSLAFICYDQSSGLSGNKIYSVMTHRDSVICFAEDGNMNIISRNGISVNYSSKGINAYELKPGKEELFVSDYSSYVYNLKTGKQTKVYLNAQKELIFTRKVYVSSTQNIYIATSEGVGYVNKDNFVFTYITDKFTHTSSVFASNDTVWFSSPDGLFIYTKNHIDTLGNIFPLLKNRVDDIAEDSHQRLWLATKGAGILIKTGNRIMQLTAKDGLASDLCRTMLMDGKDVVWVGTNRGMSKITVLRDTVFKIENYSSTDGLISDEINKICKNGNDIYAATNQGLVKFNLNSIQEVRMPPPVYITGICINDKKVLLQSDYLLEHDENFIRLTILGLSYKTPGTINYKYRLSGLDTNWYYTKNTTIQYTTLPPGDYTFTVYAINYSNISSIKPCVIFFNIKKPYWKTWWFITLMIVLVLFCIYIVFRVRIYYVKRTEEEKTLLNKKISEVELKAIRAQMNPHFIFNSINSIQHYILINDSDMAYRYLSKFSKLISNVLENSKHEVITLHKEIETIELYVELEKLRFENKFDHQIIVDPSIDILSYGISPLLIQPYVENAIWHGLMHKQAKGLLTIRFAEETKLIRCTIEDNGVGRAFSEELKKNKTSAHRSLALSLNKERLEIIGHLFQNKLQVIITDLTDENNMPCGTRVEVEIPKINFNDYDKSHNS
ncbi:MAG: ligand-binding sensor domain-containing protein [Bacteroidia bacterium]